MYSIYDKESAINQVLRYLNLSENGIYSERARSAVRLHQRKNGIDESGIVSLFPEIILTPLYSAVVFSGISVAILYDITCPYSPNIASSSFIYLSFISL